eukprot:7309294-Prymnesium_polylepis.1
MPRGDREGRGRQDAPAWRVRGWACAGPCGPRTWKRRMPASSSPTKPPVMYFMKIGKYFRNHGRFSRKRGDSAMQPG